MKVRDDIRKCVVFIGYRVADGSMRLAGSAFFLGKGGDTDKASDVFLVTARHVIDGIRKLGLNEVYLRANVKGGESAWAKCGSNEWLFHPTDQSVDVAVLSVGVPENFDHLV